jgi:hypothetical protein
MCIVVLDWTYSVALGWTYAVALTELRWKEPAKYTYMHAHICIQSKVFVICDWLRERTSQLTEVWYRLRGRTSQFTEGGLPWIDWSLCGWTASADWVEHMLNLYLSCMCIQWCWQKRLCKTFESMKPIPRPCHTHAVMRAITLHMSSIVYRTEVIALNSKRAM